MDVQGRLTSLSGGFRYFLLHVRVLHGISELQFEKKGLIIRPPWMDHSCLKILSTFLDFLVGFCCSCGSEMVFFLCEILLLVRNETLKVLNSFLRHQGGSVGWASDSWFQLRWWSHGLWVRSPCWALSWWRGACLGFSVSLSLKNK